MRTLLATVLVVPVLATGLAACTPPRQVPDADDKDIEAARSFHAAEESVLRTVGAADARFGKRSAAPPAEGDIRRVMMEAITAEESSLGVVDGAIDAFSFDARGRALARAAAAAAAEPAPRALASEGELLRRAIASETARLDEERDLPRSASTLLASIARAWTAPGSPEAMAERDRWLARRLREVRAAVESKGLDRAQARELDDVLDVLEKKVAASVLPASTAELVKVRTGLEEGAPKAAMPIDWATMGKRVTAHLGLAPDAAALERRLDAAQTKLEALAKAARETSGVKDDELAQGVTKFFEIIDVETPCRAEVAGSLLRSSAAPPERDRGCKLRRLLGEAGTDRDRALVYTILHEEVVLARWALAIAQGTPLATATGKVHLATGLGPDVRPRLERSAYAHAVAAMGAGLTVAILVDATDPRARAKAWETIGDVPLDVAETELRGR